MTDADIKRYFEEWVVGQAIGPFPPHQLIVGVAMDILHDFLRHHRVDLFGNLTPVKYEDMGFVDIAEDVQAVIEHCLQKLDSRCHNVYFQWLISPESPAPVARLAKADLLAHANDAWYFESQDAFMFDASLGRFLCLKSKGSVACLDLVGYAKLCSKYHEIRQNDKGKQR